MAQTTVEFERDISLGLSAFNICLFLYAGNQYDLNIFPWLIIYKYFFKKKTGWKGSRNKSISSHFFSVNIFTTVCEFKNATWVTDSKPFLDLPHHGPSSKSFIHLPCLEQQWPGLGGGGGTALYDVMWRGNGMRGNGNQFITHVHLKLDLPIFFIYEQGRCK